MKTIRFGIIGCGLMGREFASAAARWCHLTDMAVRPEVVAVCGRTDGKFPWYAANFPSIQLTTTDYREVLAADIVDAVYCAVPHHLHRGIYCDTISTGKALLGEKPFGIDAAANDAISRLISKQPDVFVRCSSEFAFFPAVQQIGRMVEADAFGRIIEANCGFQHCSDLDPDKPINWKRVIEYNGEYGCMGDLGMHICHVPFRAGWRPINVRAVLSNIMADRPDGAGGRVPCETWDNATLLCETVPPSGEMFPMTLRTQRISPGEMNTWSIEIKGTCGCARFSTKNPRRLELLEYSGGDQQWRQIDVGYAPAFKTITGGNFEFGFCDAMQQMMAAFLYEMTEGKPISRFAGCVTPDEVALSHRLFTAALESQTNQSTVSVC